MAEKTSPWTFDVRVRDRNLKAGSVTDKDVEKYLAALPDLADQTESFATSQPALAQPIVEHVIDTSYDDDEDEDEDEDDEEDDDDVEAETAVAAPAAAPEPVAAAAPTPAPIPAPVETLEAAPADEPAPASAPESDPEAAPVASSDDADPSSPE